MAINLWRQRRVLIAECAEIRRNSEFVEFDRRQKELKEAEDLSHKLSKEVNRRWVDVPAGLMWSIENQEVLERCIELLLELQQRIKAKGFDKAQDELLLRTIYGDPGVVHLRQTLQDEYVTWFCTAEVTEEKRAQEGYATPEQCVRIVLRAVGAEIRRLEQYQEKRESIESERGKVEILRQCVPDSPGLDRLLRYASSLERAFDRVLTQFDNAQQIRREQSPAPGGSR